MKTEDIERLKEICEENGFEVTRSREGSILFHITKKDPWDGVEFAKGLVNIEGNLEKNRCFRIIKIAEKWKDGHKHVFFYRNGRENYTHITNVTPSTESEYLKQLKDEFIKRFPLKKDSIIDYSETGIDPIEGFVYNKVHDSLHWCGVPVYCAGKWAKVVEKPKVKFITSNGMSNNGENGKFIGGEYNFKFMLENIEYANLHQIGQFLSKQLENYLNQKPKSNWCKVCDQVFSDSLVDGRCSECR